jgi:hypothetical protein
MRNEPHVCRFCTSAFGSAYDKKRHEERAHKEELMEQAGSRPWTPEEDAIMMLGETRRVCERCAGTAGYQEQPHDATLPKPEHAPECDLPCSVDPCDHTECTRDDDPAQCEPCDNVPATQRASGVYLCDFCAAVQDTVSVPAAPVAGDPGHTRGIEVEWRDTREDATPPVIGPVLSSMDAREDCENRTDTECADDPCDECPMYTETPYPDVEEGADAFAAAAQQEHDAERIPAPTFAVDIAATIGGMISEAETVEVTLTNTMGRRRDLRQELIATLADLSLWQMGHGSYDEAELSVSRIKELAGEAR